MLRKLIFVFYNLGESEAYGGRQQFALSASQAGERVAREGNCAVYIIMVFCIVGIVGHGGKRSGAYIPVTWHRGLGRSGRRRVWRRKALFLNISIMAE